MDDPLAAQQFRPLDHCLEAAPRRLVAAEAQVLRADAQDHLGQVDGGQGKRQRPPSVESTSPPSRTPAATIRSAGCS
ncbi:MAG TPA: hypothetical protein VM264_00040 [Acidimicrobiales bacterium]|nr:hypothetical protein [Acidimicrobiales bacterium]